MEKDELLIVLSELESKARNGNLSGSDKTFIQRQCEIILRRALVKFCDNSYHDAIIEMSIKLKKINNMDDLKKSKYLLKNGVILQIEGDPKVYSNANLTDEAAERYLSKNTAWIVRFAAYPEDWEKRVAKVPKLEKEKKTVDATAHNEQVDALSQELAAEKAKVEKLEAVLKDERARYEDVCATLLEERKEKQSIADKLETLTVPTGAVENKPQRGRPPNTDKNAPPEPTRDEDPPADEDQTPPMDDKPSAENQT